MAEQKSFNSQSGFAMNGGDGVHSYAKNSSLQRTVIDAAKLLIHKSITENLEPLKFHGVKTFCIADLGCSVGSNTLTAVDNIIQAVNIKYLKTNESIPEFQVYFNDYSVNDFNTLFKSLPPNREYYASGVPGSFYTRLFPRESLHFVHSSSSLHWLSQVPKEIIDKNSRAWNKGRIFHVGAGEEVTNAYSRQYAMDFDKFLQARAQEVVPGGLIALVFQARPNGLPHSRLLLNMTFDMLGACLMDLARKGVIDEEKVHAFNIPLYFPSPEELEEVIKKNGHFSIEKMEGLPELVNPDNPPTLQSVSQMIRAGTEEIMREQFGHQILDELFGLLPQKFSDSIDDITSSSRLTLFVLLKLNNTIPAISY